ncbi:MAG: hypothetical protein EXR69_10390 [Myxococcales bacterium]|nr:hypothetical protein [Myxococcales bacterium]
MVRVLTLPLPLPLLGALLLLVLPRAAVAAPAVLEADGPYRDSTRWMVELREGSPLPADLVALPLRFPTEPSMSRFRVSRTLPTGPAVLRAWRPFLAVPPPDTGDTGGPGEVEPTPDLRPLQTWLDADFGIGASEAARFPGGDGAGRIVADIEYGWEMGHEDLAAAVDAFAWGWNSDEYRFHGTSVLAQLRGTQNGFGVDGAIGAATVMVISPFEDEATYDVAAAILAAKGLLEAGDVLLIEQQAYVGGDYCPVEIDPGVYSAIERVTRAGIVVIEPGGNGAQDLDDPIWEGWFDRTTQDSGAVMVGGGASPLAYWDTRSWMSSGSSYGARVDVQGWYDSIVTATNGDYDGAYADLWYPDEDTTRAYTASFNGTSGAAPMVAAVALVAQSVRIARTGSPWEPADLREVLVGTGLPQPIEQAERIGPLPNLRTLLRTYGRP